MKNSQSQARILWEKCTIKKRLNIHTLSVLKETKPDLKQIITGLTFYLYHCFFVPLWMKWSKMLMVGCFQNGNDPNKWEMSVAQSVCGEGPALSFSEDITGWDGVLCAWCSLPPQAPQHWVSPTPICHFIVCSILSWIVNKQLTDTQLRDHTLNSTGSQAELSPVIAIVLDWSQDDIKTPPHHPHCTSF